MSALYPTRSNHSFIRATSSLFLRTSAMGICRYSILRPSASESTAAAWGHGDRITGQIDLAPLQVVGPDEGQGAEVTDVVRGDHLQHRLRVQRAHQLVAVEGPGREQVVHE